MLLFICKKKERKKCKELRLITDFFEFTENLVKGACLLASGGGGSYSSAKRLLDAYRTFPQSKKKAPLEVLKPKEAVPGGYAVVLAFLGSPEALENAGEKPINAAIAVVEEQIRLLEQREQVLSYLVPVELGAVNSLIPCIVAHYFGLAVIDGDGAGRAIPTLEVSSFSAEKDLSLVPCVFEDHNHHSVTLNSKNDAHCSVAIAEQLARPVVSTDTFGGYAGLALWPMSHEQLCRAVKITGSLSRAAALGHFLNSEATASVTDMLAFVNANHADNDSYKVEGQLLFSGQLVAASTSTGGGFDYGSVVIEGKTDRFTGLFQNETLLCWSSGSDSPLAMAPDSIAYFVEDTTQVYSNGDLVDGKTGQIYEQLVGVRCHVIRFSAQPSMMCKPVVDEFGKILNRMGYYGRLKV